MEIAYILTFTDKILEKFTTRNILALLITGTFLTVILVLTFNPERMVLLVDDNQELVIGGAIVFGALIATFANVTQFYFRKAENSK